MSDRLTRRTMISIVSTLPLLAATGGLALAADDSGGTKKQFKYQDKPGPGAKKCAGCSFFVKPNGCKIVKGKISPNGYCISYVPAAK